MTTNTKPVITKTGLQAMFATGALVEDVAKTLSEQIGTKISVGTIKTKCKEWGIDLKRKPTQKTKNLMSFFVDDTLSTTSNAPIPATTDNTVALVGTAVTATVIPVSPTSIPNAETVSPVEDSLPF